VKGNLASFLVSGESAIVSFKRPLAVQSAGDAAPYTLRSDGAMEIRASPGRPLRRNVDERFSLEESPAVTAPVHRFPEQESGRTFMR